MPQNGDFVNLIKFKYWVANLNFTTVISPMKECLTLPAPARQIAGVAIFFDLTDVPSHRLPTTDLPAVFFD